VHQVAGPFPLVPLYRGLGFQVPQPNDSQLAECPDHGGVGSLKQASDVTEVQTLVPQLHGLLQLLRIKRPPLGAAHTPLIRQGRWPA